MKKTNYFHIYFVYLKNQLLGIIEYKLDFFIGLLSVFFEQILSLTFISIIFLNIQEIAGWSYSDLLLIFSFSILGRSIHIIFFDNMWVFGSKYIQKGELDRLLLRPINPLFQLIAEKINYQGIGQIIVGSIALNIALTNLGIEFSVFLLIKIILLIIISGAVYTGIHLFYMTLSIWVIDSLPIFNTIFALNQFSQYPLNIFPKFLQFILLFIIPYGFTGFIPSNLFFEESIYTKLLFLSPFFAIALWIINYQFWVFGLKHYKSTGT